MHGIVILLLISALVLYFAERKSLFALGLIPSMRGVGEIAGAFLFVAALCTAVQLIEAFVASAEIRRNQTASNEIIQMFWWDFRSVLTEELVFRGALLIILINRIGIQRAILISASAFGVYHWFSFGIFGNVIPMIFVFIGTGLMGYGFALSFARTQTIWMPTALHLGW
ncbi:MAG TPA: CPBP family intramembrane glutamic endopeptidase, partial [Chryseosolibacter sp.]|nr:CPBP family intramembrane glutamic endopeptidase [Chryseosolibacter sp.]